MASIRQRNGSWIADIRRKGHKSISKSFRTKGMAQAWAREVEAKIDASQFSDVRGLANMTLGDLIDRYTTEIGGITPFRRNKADVLRIWKKDYGAKPLSEITDKLLIEYAQKRALKVSGSTIGVDLSYLGVVLKTARELWRIPVDVSITGAARASLKYIGVSTKGAHRQRRPTQKEINDICLHFTTKVRQKVPMEDLILFAIETAMRLGEILRIKWEDVDHVHRTVIIRDRKHPTDKEGNDQEVPLLGKAYEIVMRQKKTDDRIFPVTDGTVSTLFPRACGELGIVDLRFHDLRHEGVSRLFEQGYRIEQVALVSGHLDWRMLARYTQIRAKDLHRDTT